MAFKKICGKTGCYTLIDYDTKYCDKHADQGILDKRERNRYYDEHRRNKEATEFYRSQEWLITRQEALIRDNYLCLDCYVENMLRAADLVDHVLPLEYFSHLKLELSNLRSLCHMHHNKKTALDKNKYGGHK